jgi:hypothetical protein
MDRIDRLLSLAVEDNIAWCSAVCSAHGSNEATSSRAWVNFNPSPQYYPNLITREPGSGSDVAGLVDELRRLGQPKGWGIKDSFCDLALSDQGFEIVLEGDWYGSAPPDNRPPAAEGWARAVSSEDLLDWEMAWGGDRDRRIFKDALLSDRRIEFWFRQSAGSMAGFICFNSGSSIGLSNWFSADNQSLGEMGAPQVAWSRFPDLPLVMWSTDDPSRGSGGLHRLGPLRVWLGTH